MASSTAMSTTSGITQGTASGTTTLGTQAMTSSSPGKKEKKTPSLPPNFYPTSPSGLQCITEEFVWSIGATTFDSMPTYARHEAV